MSHRNGEQNHTNLILIYHKNRCIQRHLEFTTGQVFFSISAFEHDWVMFSAFNLVHRVHLLTICGDVYLKMYLRLKKGLFIEQCEFTLNIFPLPVIRSGVASQSFP
ncbi:hypothetical protein XENOCAPTIV_002954 [Xenoophorus captivus]|uniref:Uncharacterized protein n=1 Tax=Xenoophorus captivus TaxID=1517983 RepID=A0ABV0RWJ8_9TELE